MVLRFLAPLLALPLLAAAETPPAGVVRLSRAEYDKLKDAADRAQETPARRQAVVPPSVESAAYELRVSPDRIALEMTADILVKPSAAESRLVLPPAGLLDALTDRGPATVAASGDGSGVALVFPKPGRYRIAARWLPAEERAEGQRSLQFPVLAAAAARLSGFGSDTLFVATSGGPLQPLPAGASRPVPASSFVRAVVRSTARITTPSEKPLLLADTADVFRVERDRVTQRVFVRVSVTRAPLPQVVLLVAPGGQVASISGPSDPTFAAGEDGRIVLTTNAPVSGDAAFSLLLTRPAPEGSAPLDLVPTRVDGAASSRSWILLEPNPTREQQTRPEEGLKAIARVDVEDLPAFALPFSSEGTRAYRVTGAAPRLGITAKLRDVVAPPDTLLSDADLLTVFGDGGSRVDRRRFSFETRLPHLDVPIPEGEEVLSVSVDGTPVTPRMDASALVVSLPPAADGARRVVEVVSKSAVSVPKKRGDLVVAQRPLPGIVSLARWTIVVPEDRRYRVAKTTGIGRVSWSEDQPATMARVDTRRQSWSEADASLDSRLEVGSVAPTAGGGTSSLNVVVADQNNAPLPGVSVELKGPAFPGTRVIVTDGAGRGFFPNLPAGRYTVTASLSGFSKVERTATLNPNAGILVPLTMSVSVKEEVVVTGEAPVVDVTKTTIGQTFSMPQGGGGGGKDLSGLFRKKAKTAPQPVPVEAPAVSGATGLENAYVIDGVNQAGPRSLAMEVQGHGKRLLLSGPMVGAEPLEVVLEVKPK